MYMFLILYLISLVTYWLLQIVAGQLRIDSELGRHSEGLLWYRVRVSDWRTFDMTALRYGGPKPNR